MIGSLAGILAHKSPPQLLLEVGGVGYELEAPMSTFYDLPALGERVRLLTHLVVREDAQLLYGFATEAERRLFRNLLKIAGIGPRTALAILSGVSSAAFAQAVQEQDSAALMRIPGVGRKTAERLIVEMRDRLREEASALTLHAASPTGSRVPNAQAEAYGALVALGYKPAEATRLLKVASGGETEQSSWSTEELIRRALQSAAPAP
ncbi:MAG TPA: Holliday junction branch migration protein RuvA [Steroidobacteraceae bacterium]|nr:Holliday junction branch migration protein RuvA [Steroidobacteraceae bacterium]